VGAPGGVSPGPWVLVGAPVGWAAMAGGPAGWLAAMPEIVYPPVLVAAKLLFRVLDLRIRVDGAQYVPVSGGAVIACNHVSYLDFVFCGLGARRSHRLVRFMAKKEVFDHRVSGPLMRGMRHIPVDRKAGLGSYRQAPSAPRGAEA